MLQRIDAKDARRRQSRLLRKREHDSKPPRGRLERERVFAKQKASILHTEDNIPIRTRAKRVEMNGLLGLNGVNGRRDFGLHDTASGGMNLHMPGMKITPQEGLKLIPGGMTQRNKRSTGQQARREMSFLYPRALQVWGSMPTQSRRPTRRCRPKPNSAHASESLRDDPTDRCSHQDSVILRQKNWAIHLALLGHLRISEDIPPPHLRRVHDKMLPPPLPHLIRSPVRDPSPTTKLRSLVSPGPNRVLCQLGSKCKYDHDVNVTLKITRERQEKAVRIEETILAREAADAEVPQKVQQAQEEAAAKRAQQFHRLRCSKWRRNVLEHMRIKPSRSAFPTCIARLNKGNISHAHVQHGELFEWNRVRRAAEVAQKAQQAKEEAAAAEAVGRAYEHKMHGTLALRKPEEREKRLRLHKKLKRTQPDKPKLVGWKKRYSASEGSTTSAAAEQEQEAAEAALKVQQAQAQAARQVELEARRVRIARQNEVRRVRQAGQEQQAAEAALKAQQAQAKAPRKVEARRMREAQQQEVRQEEARRVRQAEQATEAALKAQQAQENAARQAEGRRVREAQKEEAQRARQAEQEAQIVELAKEEASMTMQHIVLGFTAVTFSAGLAIQHVLLGFESCRITIKSLPSNTTIKEEAFLIGHEDLKMVAIGMERVEFRQEHLSFEIMDHSGGDGMTASALDANILTLTWRAPAIAYTVTYVDSAQAETKLDKRIFLGRRLGAQISERSPGRQVLILGLPPEVTDQDVKRILRLPDPIQYTITISAPQYRAQRKLWGDLLATVQDKEQLKLSIALRHSIHIIRVEGLAYITVTAAPNGEGVRRARPRALVNSELALLESKEQMVPLKCQSVRFFVARGLAILKEELGDENLSPRPLPRTGDTGEATCHVCHDVVTSPIKLGCGRAYCSACIRHFLTSASTFPLVCMGDEDTCHVPIPIPVFQRFLPIQQLTNLLETAFITHIDHQPQDFKYCTTPDCRQVYRCNTSDTASIIHCPSCLSCVCSACHEEGHEGMTCAERKLNNDPEEQERLTDDFAIQSGFKKCPHTRHMCLGKIYVDSVAAKYQDFR
ncbi:hypothetical protein FIBSPDRAFT_901272 [Athelia psychrophila]|uniref:IBR domain-containing protein n=1 Tax=Athelia psychrophila TaxID=1759441 RepID=A0A165XEA5_9AGAM|nr:hypothetical protein FIBSPDRAFT_901272 [Fibularhizoctonia sp. CBS 109695]